MPPMGPIGRVWYYPKHKELRLDQPLTITKKVNPFSGLEPGVSERP